MHLMWQLGDGKSINFWMNNWTHGGYSLMLNTTNIVIVTTLLVKDVLTANGGTLTSLTIISTPTSWVK